MPVAIELESRCKVNLLLNILGKRVDGFHELETVMHPVEVTDRLVFERGGTGITLTCSEPSLPTDSQNLVYRAAASFARQAGIADGLRIHLEKRIPLAAGLGGGSGNGATTLLGLNQLFGSPLPAESIYLLAASLGSDVPFFLQQNPALATGRGEKVTSLEPFPALRGAAFFLVHPGFGISTPWAYQSLARFPLALNGRSGRADKLLSLLRGEDLKLAGTEFYNSLEAPALEKYPLLVLFQDFLRENGAVATLMSGSGSTTFALASNVAAGEVLAENFRSKFGRTNWTAVVPARLPA
jgi:4-diphosphocytidyl-2-C-methyl-D-erythritol kinase